MWIATTKQIREIDKRAIEEFGMPSRVLMENAGAAVFASLQQRLPSGSIGVVCGKGNNGGDGFVVAKLALNAGYLVDCVAAATREELTPEAAKTLAAFESAGGQVVFADDSNFQARLEALAAHDVVVDAVLGTGTRARKGSAAPAVERAIHAINRSETVVLSVDVPSGIDSDTGQSVGPSVVSDATVTFGLAKRFLFQNDGLEQSGDWSVADIGYPTALVCPDKTWARLIDSAWVADRLPIRDLDSNKGRNGHLLIVAGSDRMRGAPTLAAQAALRAGAGLVTVAASEVVCAAVAAHLPEVLLLPLSQNPAQQILDYADKVDAGLFGPGLGQDVPTRTMLANVFAAWTRPALVDADALNAVSTGAALPPGPCVLTPHPGEAARLLGKRVPEIQADRFESVLELAERFRKCVLLKGRHSLVAGNTAETLVNATGNPGLATGGSGDTLSGVIATLLAQGLQPEDAAACGMFWHGLAADLCAAEVGSIGYTASDVSRALPRARDTMLELS